MRRGETSPADPAGTAPRCAHCDLPAGRTPDGDDLGPLNAPEAHAARQEGRDPDPAALAARPGELSHAGCVHALRTFRPGGVKPLAPGGFPRLEGGLTVHVFESPGGSAPHGDSVHPIETRCGLKVGAPRVEWTVADHRAPNMCPGCVEPRDPSARAFPALLPEGPRS